MSAGALVSFMLYVASLNGAFQVFAHAFKLLLLVPGSCTNLMFQSGQNCQATAGTTCSSSLCHDD